MDTLFVQFYSRTSYEPMCINLGNGFSDTYDLCKSKGDYYWVEYDYEKLVVEDLPINKGTVYVSTLFVNQVYIAILWAEKYPDINFVVGGPGVHSSYLEKEAPSNFIMTEKSVEEWFNVPNFSGRWHLEIPECIPETDTIYFTYVLDNSCYWSRCNFCAYERSRKMTKGRIRKEFKFEFENIQHSGKKMIRLCTDAITSDHIKILDKLPLIDNLDSYKVFLRAGKKELKVMESLDNLEWKEHVKFNIGLEFPTNRMWKYMKKGYTEDTVIKLLKLLKVNFVIKFILGWDNLTKSDLENLENFMKQIPPSTKGCSVKTGKLFAIPKTFIHKTYKKGKEKRVGPFYLGFEPYLNSEQIKMNRIAHQIILEYAEKKNYHILDLCEFKEDL